VPTPRIGSEAKVAHIPLSDTRAKREVGLVWARDRLPSPPTERFVRFLTRT
jgi:LysR family transcriptional regulator, transcription activator of glutamate synthase operon